MKDDLLKKIKRLRKALLLSGLMNIFFLFCFILWIKETGTPIPLEDMRDLKHKNIKPFIAEKSAQEILLLLEKKSLYELSLELQNKTLVENGFTVRDFALGLLISHHNLNTDKAFGNTDKPKQKRKIFYSDASGKRKEVSVLSDAKDPHFESALSFIKKEKWPITSYGMYLKLLETKEKDLSLIYAFQCTKEFKNLEMLMHKASLQVSETVLLNLVLEGPFDNLKMLHPSLLLEEDVREIKREFLLSYITSQSETASLLLLKSDFEFAVKKTDNQTALRILSTLTEGIRESRKFALALLLSPRGDEVWNAAGKTLYVLSGEPIPEELTRHTALLRFAPVVLARSEEIPKAPLVEKKEAATPSTKEIYSKESDKKPIPPALKRSTDKGARIAFSESKRAYIVQEGDTLWKVGKRFGSDPLKIKEINHLPSNTLKPGTLINLP